MAPPMLAFGAYEPDRSAIGAAVVTAKNVVPVQDGYMGFPGLRAVLPALAAECRGAEAGKTKTGTVFNVAGTGASRLYLAQTSGAIADVSKGGIAYTALPSDGMWEFAQHGQLLIATSYTDWVQVYDFDSPGSPARFRDLGGGSGAANNVPKAKHAAIVKGFLFLGFVNDEVGNNTGDGVVPGRVHWGPYDGPDQAWPLVGTDAAKAVQSDKQDLGGGGGHILKILRLGEIALCCQERRIWRADYVGGDRYWDFNEVETDRGIIAPGAIAAAGRRAVYRAEDGFYVTDGSSSLPIGRERVDRAFLADLDTDYLHRISALSDPRRNLIAFAYPGSGHSNGVPNKILLYDWALDRWAGPVEVDVETLVRVLPPGDSLDDLNDDLDVDYTDSFDEITSYAYPWLFGAYDSAHRLSSFSGAPLDIELETGDAELFGGRIAHVKGVRPVVSRGTPRVSIGYRDTPTASVAYSASSAPNALGICEQRTTGRYVRARTTLADLGEGDVIVHGLDVDAIPGGQR